MKEKEEKEFFNTLKKIDKRITLGNIKFLMMNKKKKKEFFDVIDKLIKDKTIDFEPKKLFIENTFDEKVMDF